MTEQASETKRKKSLGGSLLGGGRAIWALAVGMALAAVFGALTLLGNATATQTYYVLGRDVAARTQVTPEMLVPRVAKVGQAPPNAFDLVSVRDEEVFTEIALSAGDVVSASNAGPLFRITSNVPDHFVAASFSAEPELAVAGKVRTGDHVDLIATDDEGLAGPKAQVVLQHVLVLDVTVDPSSIAAEANAGQEGEQVVDPGPESEAARSGIPSVYTVALAPADAAKLALIRGQDLFVVLSGNVPDQSATAVATNQDVFGSTTADASAGTFDSVFIKRWDVAFEVNNVYVGNDGRVWRVSAEGLWATGSTTLEAGDLPPNYLTIPVGIEFFDADNTYWVAQAKGQAAVVWVAPEKNQTLPEGDNPTGYDPHAEFEADALSEAAPVDAPVAE